MAGIRVEGRNVPGGERILTAEALSLVEKLHRALDDRRHELLQRRQKRQAELFDKGGSPDFLPETASVRSADWKVAPAPGDLQRRHIEITGPVERKMMINALNSGADVFMADFEDSLSPTWSNIVTGQANCMDAVRRTIEFKNPDGKVYKLKDKVATLVVRPRGWHLDERHVTVDGKAVSGSLFDFALYFFHNARELITHGSGPYFYLPKMESHLEARLWNDAFKLAQDALKVPQGTIRATVLIETLPAAFEMDEILYELREHMSGLNAGRWDYMFSLIKKLRNRKDLLLPDRVQITMTVPFMRAYTELLVKTCHRRGAHAMGGMSPFIPSRKDAAVNERAMAQVRADKLRETNDGFDGTWVAHPDLVPVAREAFDKVLGQKPHQKERLRDEVSVKAAQLVDTHVPGGKITEAGFRLNVSVALQYMNQWLLGNGAAAINNLMEDAATAEISRGQLWQWLKNGASLDDGRKVDRKLYETIRAEEVAKLGGVAEGRYKDCVALLDELVDTRTFHDFLTTIAYPKLD